MKFPEIKKLKIGGSWYDVEYVDDLRDEHDRKLGGRILQNIRVIKIDTDASYQTMLQTIYHESVHGIMWEYAINDVEDLVAPISNGFYAFIIDNPELVRGILKCAEEIKR